MINIDPDTHVITIPQADLDDLGGGSYQLDTYQFHIWLRDWEDSEDGIFQPPTHNHNTAVTLGGIQYARVIEVLAPYTITFQDTGSPYKVFLIGSNNNILDVTNLNQVSVAPNNSAGLINVTEVQYAAFGGGVSLDEINGQAGTTYPIGTLRYPSNNLAEALTIAEGRGFEQIFIHGNVTLHSGDDVSGRTIKGEDRDSTTLILESGASTIAANLYDLKLTGVCGGRMNIHFCTLENVTGLCASGGDANIFNCKLAGTIQFRNIADQNFNFTNCVGKSGLTIDTNGCPANVHFTDFAGLLTFSGITNALQDVQMDIDSGKLTLDSSCTGGAITLRGTGTVTDDSAGTTVDTSGLVQLSDVQYASFDGGVHIDPAMGDDANTGNHQYPVQTCARAVAVLNERGFKKVHVMGNLTLNSDAVFPGCILTGVNKLTTTLTVDAAADVTNAIFRNLTITGTLDSNSMIEDCVIEDLAYVEGDIHRCEVTGLLTCAGTAGLEIYDSYSGRQGTADPAIIDMDGAATGSKNVAIHNWSGHMKVRNMTGGYLGISCAGGANIKVESTCTAGFIHIMGNVKLTDQSAGATVRTNYKTDPSNIASVLRAYATTTPADADTVGKQWEDAAAGGGGGGDASWSQALPNGFTEGQAGWLLSSVYDLVSGFQQSLSTLAGKAYSPGLVSIPTNTVAGDKLIFYANTDYDNVTFTAGVAWESYLSDPNTEVWWTVKSNPRQTTPLLEIQLTVVDAVSGQLSVNLTAANLDIEPGTYYWQVQLRDESGAPVERRIAMEGLVYIKPIFKD